MSPGGLDLDFPGDLQRSTSPTPGGWAWALPPLLGGEGDICLAVVALASVVEGAHRAAEGSGLECWHL